MLANKGITQIGYLDRRLRSECNAIADHHLTKLAHRSFLVQQNYEKESMMLAIHTLCSIHQYYIGAF
jgi:hypothetical protein